ncbi:MAG: saccharopine dehydrogenase NADP-binding domain-containing protein [Thermoguttaceae bacterium]|jgi:short subunit dehydrogenase-like uncharacterized protein|nr:saccharopine dehydrogenase NADP-binding domain-containing protein [Thermoguttaceae bacterium]
MTASSDWLLYGANGYTGRLIAAEAVRRGARPILAGRSAEKIEPLARTLDCPARVFPLDDPSRIGPHLAGVRAVLHCAGPFSATAAPMREACLGAGVHYLDLTGEIDVIEAAAAQHERAVAAGVCLLPAVGFDVVPSDCLAAMLAQRLPGARRLELAFVFTGSMSPGTAKTTLEAIPRGGRVRIGGRIERVPTAWKTLEVPFPGGPRWAMTAPWGDVATAWHTTGIPDIEVYVAVPRGQIRWIRRARPLLGAFGYAPVRRLAQWWIRHFLSGPSPQALDQSTAAFWGRVTDGAGRHVEATLRTPGGYPLTVWAALGSLERVLAGSVAPGFATPAKAFGPEFILEHPEAELRWL